MQAGCWLRLAGWRPLVRQPAQATCLPPPDKNLQKMLSILRRACVAALFCRLQVALSGQHPQFGFPPKCSLQRADACSPTYSQLDAADQLWKCPSGSAEQGQLQGWPTDTCRNGSWSKGSYDCAPSRSTVANHAAVLQMGAFSPHSIR